MTGSVGRLFGVAGSVRGAWPRLKPVLLWLGLVGVVMLPRLLNLDVFVGPDELAELGRDNQFALAIARADWPATLAGDGKPSVTLMWINTIGVTLKWLWLQVTGVGLPFVQVVAPERPFVLWAERRMFLALASGLQILVAWPLLRVIWDSRIATLAVGLMAIEPFLLAFTRMIRGDSLLAGFMLLSVLGALAFVKTGQQRYNWLSGAMGGLTLLTKSSGGIVAPTVMVVYAAVALSRGARRERPGWRWLVGGVLGWGLSSAIVFFGLWPAWWVRPIDTFNLLWSKMVYHAVEATTQRAGTYFWGKMHPFGPGPWFYPVLAMLRLTPWLLLGGLAAVGHQLWRAVRPRSPAPDWNTLAVGFYVIAYWLAITLPGQKIDRYFVPVIPGLAVLAAIEIVCVARWLNRRISSRLSPVLLRLATVGIGLLMIGHVGSYHPLYSTYFDPFVGNPALLQWALPVGNGEGVDAALEHLSALPDAADSVVVCGTNFPRCRPFFPGELWHQEALRSSRWFEAVYALWHIDEQQVGAFSEEVLAYLRRQSPVYVAGYHGIDYTWLYPIPQPLFRTGGSKLEGVATLFGYDPGGRSPSELSPGDALKLHLYWQNEGQASQQRFWWRIVDSQGYVWNEAVARPLPEFEADAPQEDAVVEGEVSLFVPPDMPPGAYHLQAGFASDIGDVGQFTLPAEGSVLTVRGASVGVGNPTQVLDRRMTQYLRLRGYDIFSARGSKEAPAAPIPGEALWVTLYWEAMGQIQHDYLITLHLLDTDPVAGGGEDGKEVGSWSGRPVHDTFPTQGWPANVHVRDPRLVSLPTGLAPGQYQLALSLREVPAATELARVKLGIIDVAARRVSFETPPMQFRADYSFGDVVALLGYDLSGDLLPDSARVRVTLYWEVLQTTDKPYRINVRLVDATGLILAEQESQPAGGTIPTTEWQAGEIVTDLHEIEVAGSEPVPVNLEVRLLDAGGNSLALRDGAEALVVSDVQDKVMWRIASP